MTDDAFGKIIYDALKSKMSPLPERMTATD
jgi:hypothetical protein